MEDKDDELIERYYRNELTEAEREAFHRRLAEDEVFWEAAHLHADALNAIRLEGVGLLRKRLAKKGRELDEKAERRPRRIWLWIVPVLLLGAFAVWQWMRSEPAPQAIPAPAPPSAAPVDTSDTAPPATPRDTVARKQTPAPAAKTDRQIFAASFQPFRDESIEPSVRGGNELLSPSEHFQQLYWDGDYAAALAAFDSLGATARANKNLLFLKANCLLDAGQPEEAVSILEALVQNGRLRFNDQAPWYLALAHLRAGRRAEARSLLERIAADAASSRQADAQRILRDMK